MRKWYVVLGLFLIMSFGTAIITSCSSDDDCSSSIENYEVLNMKVVGQLLISRQLRANGTYQYLTTEYDGTARRFDGVAYEVFYDLQLLAMNRPVPSFGNQAFACSPAPLRNLITDLNIISDQNFNTVYPAGEPLNGLFLFSRDASFRMEGLSQSFLLDGSSLFFRLLQPPTESKTHKFTFQMEFEDGSSQEVTLEGIQFE